MGAYSAISSYSRVRILHLLQERPERTVDELCGQTGLHPNTVREHLQRLIDGGYVVGTTEHRTTRGRPRVLYSAASAAESNPVATRKAQDAARRGDLLRRVWPTESAGLPQDAVHQLDALVDDLEDAGFTPLVDEAALTVDLSPCPHAGSRSGDLGVLCQVHLGVMDGVLSAAGGPLRTRCLHAAEHPEDCVVQLAVRG